VGWLTKGARSRDVQNLANLGPASRPRGDRTPNKRAVGAQKPQKSPPSETGQRTRRVCDRTSCRAALRHHARRPDYRRVQHTLICLRSQSRVLTAPLRAQTGLPATCWASRRVVVVVLASKTLKQITYSRGALLLAESEKLASDWPKSSVSNISPAFRFFPFFTGQGLCFGFFLRQKCS